MRTGLTEVTEAYLGQTDLELTEMDTSQQLKFVLRVKLTLSEQDTATLGENGMVDPEVNITLLN